MTPTYHTEPPLALRSRDVHTQSRVDHSFGNDGGRLSGNAKTGGIWGAGDVATHGAVAVDGCLGEFGEGESEVETSTVALDEYGGRHA